VEGSPTRGEIVYRARLMRRVPHPAGTVGSVTAKHVVLRHFSRIASPQKRLGRNGLAAARLRGWRRDRLRVCALFACWV